MVNLFIALTGIKHLTAWLISFHFSLAFFSLFFLSLALTIPSYRLDEIEIHLFCVYVSFLEGQKSDGERDKDSMSMKLNLKKKYDQKKNSYQYIRHLAG